MSSIKRKTGYRWELTLGLALIILVLVILNIASHYAMYRLKDSLLATARDNLSETAFAISMRMIDTGAPYLSEEDEGRIGREYSFDGFNVIHLNYERALSLRNGEVPDSVFSTIGPDVTASELKPLLSQNDVFLHKSGDLTLHYLHVVEIDGSSYVLHIHSEDRVLAALERAGRVLVFFGFLGVVIIIFVSYTFIRKATRPITRLRMQAESTGHYNADNRDEIGELIRSYEKIITDLKGNEAELIRLNEMIKSRADRLEAHNEYILGSIPSGIITLDNDGHISSANRAVGRILNLDSDSLHGQPYKKALGNFEHICQYVQVFTGDSKPLKNQEIVLSGPNGERRVLAISVTGLRDGQDNKIGTSVLINDMTELDRLQKEIEAKNAMALLGEMSGGLAHQLRNSMAAIVGLGKLIAKKVDPEQPEGKNAALILRESLEAETLVSRFLDFARPLELNDTPFDIEHMLLEVIETHKNKYHEINYHFNSDSARNSVNGDRLLLKQAVCNIVDNASQACSGRGTINISLTADDKALHIDIADDGPGIPDDIGDKIFAPFYSTNPSGTGLGLPLARKIALLHEGYLEFNKNPNGGTVFRISLPSSRSYSSPLYSDKSVASTEAF